MTEVFLEKREYATGTRYVPANYIQPGVNYYIQRRDEQGQEYYLSTSAPSPLFPLSSDPFSNSLNYLSSFYLSYFALLQAHFVVKLSRKPFLYCAPHSQLPLFLSLFLSAFSFVSISFNVIFQDAPNPYATMAPAGPMATYAPAPAYYAPGVPSGGYAAAPIPGIVPLDPVGVPPGGFTSDGFSVNIDLSRFLPAHLWITILGFFIPPVFVIGFPILFGVIKKFFSREKVSSENQRRLKSYTVVGWLAWTLTLVGIIMLGSSVGSIDYSVCYHDRSGFYSCTHYTNGGALAATIIASILWFFGIVFHFTLINVGAVTLKKL
jgi:hypothetical protein